MRGYNRITLMGNLTAEPKIEQTNSGNVACKFTVAVNRAWRNQAGDLQEDVDFIPVVAYGKIGENCGKYLEKGAGVFIDGRLSIQSYEKDGGRRWWTQVVANIVNFLPRQGQSKESADESADDVPFTDAPDEAPANEPAEW